jgi:hypothetical protein
MSLNRISNTTEKENTKEINQVNEITRWVPRLWSSFDDLLPTENALSCKIHPALLPLKWGQRQDLETDISVRSPRTHPYARTYQKK